MPTYWITHITLTLMSFNNLIAVSALQGRIKQSDKCSGNSICETPHCTLLWYMKYISSLCEHLQSCKYMRLQFQFDLIQSMAMSCMDLDWIWPGYGPCLMPQMGHIIQYELLLEPGDLVSSVPACFSGRPTWEPQPPQSGVPEGCLRRCDGHFRLQCMPRKGSWDCSP